VKGEAKKELETALRKTLQLVIASMSK